MINGRRGGQEPSDTNFIWCHCCLFCGRPDISSINTKAVFSLSSALTWYFNSSFDKINNHFHMSDYLTTYYIPTEKVKPWCFHLLFVTHHYVIQIRRSDFTKLELWKFCTSLRFRSAAFAWVWMKVNGAKSPVWPCLNPAASAETNNNVKPSCWPAMRLQQLKDVYLYNKPEHVTCRTPDDLEILGTAVSMVSLLTHTK